MQGSLLEFSIALGLFLLTHLVPVRPVLRARLTGLFGERAYLIIYSLVSLLLLIWLIDAARRAPTVLLWVAPLWLYWLQLIIMPAACILLVAGLSTPNPFSLGGGKRHFNPECPGIVAVTRHPILWALALWSLIHLTINGDLVKVILFGLFSALALGGMWLLDRKRQRQLGIDNWNRLAARTSILPFGAIVCGKARLDRHIVSIRQLLGGLALFLILLAAHQPIIGATPVPWH